MALLANYEGQYLPPQKLWYLVDGVWKEVVNVFESAIQQELALLDQDRIKQDQVVASLSSKQIELMSRLDGSDPTVPVETDPAAIDAILQEMGVIELQLEVTRTEQVILTKKLFEQKAQSEYVKLVSEGELALEKIAKLVTNPAEWGVMRIAPQSTLGERLEVAIQHGLDTNERIFNYGLVYYRLYKLPTTPGYTYSTNDDIEYLKEQFKRRMDNAAYLLGIDPTNYIFTIDDIQNVYTEVNQFVNAGARRIEDYLASIKDQQKYILDKIEDAKVAMNSLSTLVETGVITPVNNQIITVSTDPNLQVPIGEVILSSQNVTSFDQLVSTSVLQNIAAGTADINAYPGIVQLNADATALTEKINAVQTFAQKNEAIQNDLVNGTYVFNLTVLSNKKATLTPSVNLFWNTPLGSGTLASSSGIPAYKQTYTSSGTYKFKSNELVKLSTVYTAIINAISAGTCTGTFGVTLNAGEPPRIISVQGGKVYIHDLSSSTSKSAPQTAIINTNHAGTIQTPDAVNVNKNDQPHHSIIFVKEAKTVTTPANVTLSVYQPTINGLFYANTEDSQLAANTKVSTPVYEYAFNIHPIRTLDYVNPIESFGFNAKEIPLTNFFVNNDNIITQIKESIREDVLSFNAREIPLSNWFVNNQNIISQIKEAIVPQEISFSCRNIPMTSENYMFRNQNIIEQDAASKLVSVPAFSFNTKQTNSYLTVKNGYGQETSYTTGTTLGTIQIIKPALKEVKAIISSEAPARDINGVPKRLDFYQKSRIILASQTGLAVYISDSKDEKLNKLVDSMPRTVTASAVRPYDPEVNNPLGYDTVNAIIVDVPRVTTKTAVATYTAKYNEDHLNNCVSGVTQITTMIGTTPLSPDPSYLSEKLNKDISSIVSPAIQLNPGVVLV